MDPTLKEALDRARQAAAEARALVEAARRAGTPLGEASRRGREIDRVEDVGRSTVLDCLEAGDERLARQAADGLAATLVDEAERAARSLVRARRAVGVA